MPWRRLFTEFGHPVFACVLRSMANTCTAAKRPRSAVPPKDSTRNAGPARTRLSRSAETRSGPADLLAKLPQPCGHVEGIAEKRDLTMRIAAFADHDRARMKRRPKLRHRAESLQIRLRIFGNPVGDGKEAVDTASRRNPGRQRPRYDHLISHIGVNLAAMRDDRPVNVEEKAGEAPACAPRRALPRATSSRRDRGT